MTVVSVTRLRVRSARFLMLFIWHAVRSAHQAKRSRGNLGVRLRKTRGLAFWTLTMWTNDSMMREFRSAPPHREAMRKLPYWCDETSYVHWDQNSSIMPAWEDAAERLAVLGQLSRVLCPSVDHQAGRVMTT
jgi:heme-degrading monooxygenase HmoA